VNVAQRFERQQMSLFELVIFNYLYVLVWISGTSGIAALWLAARCCAGCAGVPLDAHRELEAVPSRLEKPAKAGFKCNGLIYKRGCQEHFSPSAGGAGLVCDIQRLSP
jgi:hypothetical protein